MVRSGHEAFPPLEIFAWRDSLTPDFREAAASIFYEALLPVGYGLPMWNPVPNLESPISYRRKGVSIGDLGLITDVADFKYLFNITFPIAHPVNPTDLPQDLFSPSLPVSGEPMRMAANHSRFKTFESRGIDVADCEDRRYVITRTQT